MKANTFLKLSLAGVAAAAIAACGPAKQTNDAKPGHGGRGAHGGGTAAAAPVNTPPPAKQMAATMGSSNPQAMASFRAAVAELEQIRKDGTGSFDGPISKLKDATSADSDFALAWYDLGTIYEDLGKYGDAEDAFQRAARANPDLGEAVASLGRIFVLKGDLEKAKSFYEDRLTKDPKNKEVRNHLADIYRLEKNYSEANEQIKKVLFADPDNIEAYKTLALVFMDQKKYDMAKMTCANALKIDQSNAGVYNALGLVFLAQGQIRDAAAQFETALEKDPGYAPALANLGSIALDHKDYNLAGDCFGKLAKLRPSSPAALNAYAVALRGQKKYDDARALYQKVHELDSSNVEVSFNLGVLYQKGYNDPTTALRYYNDYIQKAGVTDPNAPVMALVKRANEDVKAQQMMNAPPKATPTPAGDNVASPETDGTKDGTAKDAPKGGAAATDGAKKDGTPAAGTDGKPKDQPKAEKSGTNSAAKGSATKMANH